MQLFTRKTLREMERLFGDGRKSFLHRCNVNFITEACICHAVEQFLEGNVGMILVLYGGWHMKNFGGRFAVHISEGVSGCDIAWSNHKLCLA